MSTKHLSKGSRMPMGNKGKLRLFTNRFCPYCQRVQLVLDAKKLQYDVIYVNMHNKPDWFYQISPLGKLPALELENGDVLYESLIIVDYLDEKYIQHPLHHKDPLKKAKDKILIEQFSKVVNTMYNMLMLTTTNDDNESVISDGLETFEKELNNRQGPFYGGMHPGMLDYMIWPWCERAELLKLFSSYFRSGVLNKNKYKKLMEWKNRMNEDTAVKKTFIDTETHIKFVQSHRAGIPEYDLVNISV
ncbi:pyrimidodiazepine synthase-like [Onthophagus taurus]|uniref:pyrimidodiazepine synthase-like n=1 Tax=Onthophagus taurus TaxID=166361 RepID=UPI000C20C0A8|nr:pyrimidodiazepine synthase-like [Onthophagus taurus]